VVRLTVAGAGSLTRRPKRSHRCLLVEVPWQINEQVLSNIDFLNAVAKNREIILKLKQGRTQQVTNFNLQYDYVLLR